MTEPVTGAAGGAALAKWLWPIAKLVGVPAAGVVGAMLVAAFDPAEAVPDPKKRRKLLLVQYTAALVVAAMFTFGTVTWLDFQFDWITLPKQVTNADEAQAWLEIILPVGFLYGSLSIGIIGALVKLRAILKDKAAAAIARRIGLEGDL